MAPVKCVACPMSRTLLRLNFCLDLMTSLKAISRSMTASDQVLATVVRRLRTDLGMTQEALAFKAEVTLGTLSRVERGVTNPAWPTLLKIADALGITPVELITEVEAARNRLAQLDGDVNPRE